MKKSREFLANKNESTYFCKANNKHTFGTAHRSMLITLIQPDIRWGDIEANTAHMEQLLATAPPSELYVLPEMWSTGFCTDPSTMAEESALAEKRMKRLSDIVCSNVAGGMMVKETLSGEVNYFNRHYLSIHGKEIVHYDKRHLFGYGGEGESFTQGEKRVVVTCCGWRWLLQTCYDLRFPVWSRYRGDYDGILYIASWPTKRRNAWETLLRARAIENQCVVCGVNRVGTDPRCSYSGGSMLFNERGELLTQCADDKEGFASYDLQLDSLEEYRNRFPVLGDRDNYEFIY